MEIDTLLKIMGIAERLKCETRHSYTSSGRLESVAEHSFRLAVMAWLLRDEFSDMDMDRVQAMCLFHDFGEAFTGDIPVFEKTEGDGRRESDKVEAMLSSLPESAASRLRPLFEEMEELSTPEARLYKALDKIEAVIQHDESDIKYWLPLEYDLQLKHGERECAQFDYTRRLKERVDEITRDKIARAGGKPEQD